MKVQTIGTNLLVQSDILEAEFVLLDRICSVKMGHVHPRKGHVVHILNQFQLNGSSGVHTCLTFPVVGPSLSAYLYASLSKKVDYMLVYKTACFLLWPIFMINAKLFTLVSLLQLL